MMVLLGSPAFGDFRLARARGETLHAKPKSMKLGTKGLLPDPLKKPRFPRLHHPLG